MTPNRHSVSLAFRVTASVAAIALGSGVLFSHLADRLYPVLPVALFLVLMSILAGSRVDGANGGHYLALAVAAGVGFAVYLFLFPESLVGIDPNNLAVEVQQLRTQETLAVIESRFYSNVPFYFLLPAMAGAISGISSQDSLVVYPALMTAVVALSAALLARTAFEDGGGLSNGLTAGVNRGPRTVGVTAAVLGISATTSLRFAYWPIPQTLATVFFLTLIVTMARDYIRPSRTWLGIAVALVWALAFTHKLPLVVFLTLLVGLGAMTVSQRLSWSTLTPTSTRDRAVTFLSGSVVVFALWLYGTQFFTSDIFRIVGAAVFFLVVATVLYVTGPPSVENTGRSSERRVRNLSALAVTTAVAVAFQWLALTDYATRAFLRVWGFLGADVTVVSSFEATAPAAQPPGLPLFGVFFHHSNALVLLLAGGVAWLGLVTFRTPDRRSATLLIGTAVCLVPVALTAVNPSTASPFRFLLLAEPLLAAVLAVVVGPSVRSQRTDIASVVAVLLVALLVFQLFSFLVVPDYGASPRYYLNEQETEAKNFGLQHLDSAVGTDSFTVTAATGEQITAPRFQEGDSYRSAETQLLAGNLSDRRPPYYLSRSIDVYRTSTGWWQLAYQPTRELDATEHRMYDNGAVTIHRRPL